MTIREQYEQTERQMLSPQAVCAADSRGRAREEQPCHYRTAFQRDRDRVIHSKAFRRLKHKTQVFLAPEGDHYRTRLTHTLEVSQIARTIARALRLNEDLTEAIALAHDLGHTPFGHAGERALNDCMPGGFRHYEHSVRVVDKLERDGRGLNLTWEVRDGILHHTKDEWAHTLEGRIVRWADHIAYTNHDMDDAISAHLLSEADVPADVRQALGDTHTKRIDTAITAVIEASGDDIRMASDIEPYFNRLNDFMFEALYFNPLAKSEETKADHLIKELFAHFTAHPEKMPEEYLPIAEAEGNERAACDYLASMTDNYALSVFNDLYIPKGWALHTFG